MKKLLLKILGMNVCGWCGGLFCVSLTHGRYCIKCADEGGKHDAELKHREYDLIWARLNPDKLRTLVKEEEAKDSKANANQMGQLGGLANQFGEPWIKNRY